MNTTGSEIEHHINVLLSRWPRCARKLSGSYWDGRIVGIYSTIDTPIGFAIQQNRVDGRIITNGAVQIFPQKALELYND